MRILTLLACTALLAAGCEDGGSNPYADKLSAGKNSGAAKAAAPAGTNDVASASASTNAAAQASIDGTWTLTGDDGSSWYATFSSNGSWIISDDKAGNKLRVYGTYSESGGNFSGPMTNPGVGTGKISGSYSANLMTLYFTENWHTPAKTVHYKGTR